MSKTKHPHNTCHNCYWHNRDNRGQLICERSYRNGVGCISIVSESHYRRDCFTDPKRYE